MLKSWSAKILNTIPGPFSTKFNNEIMPYSWTCISKKFHQKFHHFRTFPLCGFLFKLFVEQIASSKKLIKFNQSTNDSKKFLACGFFQIYKFSM